MTDLPETKDLILEAQGSVLTIWFNRPQAKNSLSSEMVSELHAVLDVAAQDASLRTLIIRGKGGVFCAGADIKGFKSGLQDVEPNAEDVARGNRFFGDLMIKLNEQPQTVIMLVEGAAIGGGLGLCCIGDVTIVTRDAKFRLSETSLGIPPAQIAPFVTERVGLNLNGGACSILGCPISNFHSTCRHNAVALVQRLRSIHSKVPKSGDRIPIRFAIRP